MSLLERAAVLTLAERTGLAVRFLDKEDALAEGGPGRLWFNRGLLHGVTPSRRGTVGRTEARSSRASSKRTVKDSAELQSSAWLAPDGSKVEHSIL